jgi:hypothetical protein
MSSAMEVLCALFLVAGLVTGQLTGWDSPPCRFALVTGGLLLMFIIITAYPAPFDRLAQTFCDIGTQAFFIGFGLALVAMIEIIATSALIMVFPAVAFMLLGLVFFSVSRFLSFVTGNKREA